MQYRNFKYSCLLHDIASCILLLPGGQIRLNLSFLPVHKQSVFRVHNFYLPELFLSLPLPPSPLNVIHDPCNLHQWPQSLISGEHGAVLCDASSPPPPFFFFICQMQPMLFLNHVFLTWLLSQTKNIYELWLSLTLQYNAYVECKQLFSLVSISLSTIAYCFFAKCSQCCFCILSF